MAATDRTSKLAFARLVESAGKTEAADFLRDFIEAGPYQIYIGPILSMSQGMFESVNSTR